MSNNRIVANIFVGVVGIPRFLAVSAFIFVNLRQKSSRNSCIHYYLQTTRGHFPAPFCRNPFQYNGLNSGYEQLLSSFAQVFFGQIQNSEKIFYSLSHNDLSAFRLILKTRFFVKSAQVQTIYRGRVFLCRWLVFSVCGSPVAEPRERHSGRAGGMRNWTPDRSPGSSQCYERRMRCVSGFHFHSSCRNSSNVSVSGRWRRIIAGFSGRIFA